MACDRVLTIAFELQCLGQYSVLDNFSLWATVTVSLLEFSY